MLDPRFIVLGAVLGIVGDIKYAYNTLKGTTKPNRITWGLWAVAPSIVLVVQLSEGIGWPAVNAFTAAFGPAVIFLASFANRKSYWAVSRLDIACGMFSGLALALWAVTRNGDVAIALGIIADALAGIPTVIKAYRKPRTENLSPFLFGTVNAAIVLLTVTEWRFAVYGFSVYILLLCLLLTFLIAFPRLRFRKASA